LMWNRKIHLLVDISLDGGVTNRFLFAHKWYCCLKVQELSDERQCRQ
jgi:hypothetical protein